MGVYIPNKLFPQEMALDREYIDALYDQALKLVNVIKAVAPVDSGSYKDSIRARKTLTSVTVGTNDFAGHIIEWGSVKTPAMAPIRRGVLAAGLRLDEI
jgi:hypothetical protein